LALCEQLSSRNIRVDVDDRSDTVGRRIRQGEQEWIPYILVIGANEVSSGKFRVRSRTTPIQDEMPVEALVDLIHRNTAGMPFRPLPLPTSISHRPIFVG
jgi:threonyl-tRNA synthetase